MILYRFVAPGREDLLFKQRQIWFTPIKYFNDPFDFLPGVAFRLTKTWEAALRGGSDMSTLVSKLRGITGEDVLALKRQVMDRFKHVLRKHGEEMANRMYVEMREFASQRYGILCLSSSKDQLLMWSHYAQCHRGYALAFDAGEEKIKLLGNVRKVRYSSKRPLHVNNSTVSSEVFFVKCDIWRYEREWRISRELKDCSIHLEEGGRELFVSNIPVLALKAIYFGAFCSQQTVDAVRNSLSDLDVMFFKGHVNSTSFRIDWQPLEN